MTALSQNPCTSCSGEYESKAAPRWRASVSALPREPALCTVSASVKSSHSPRATLAPDAMALFLPVQSGGGGPASTTRTDGKDSAMARVRSEEPSSTTRISKGAPDCPTRDSRQEARHSSSLRAGMITDTVGLPDTISGAIIGRISYYNFVYRFLVPFSPLAFF